MQSKESSGIPRATLASAFILAFAMWVPTFCIPPMEHILKEGLHITHAQASLLFSIPIWMVGAVALPAGLIADKIGFKKAGGIGAILIVLGSLLRTTATDASSLIAFTFIYGVGFGWAFASLPKMISAWVPREKVGIATGIYTAGMFTGNALALALTMPLVFPLTNSVQGVFFFWSIPAIVAIVTWWVFVKEPPAKSLNVESMSRNNVSFRPLLSKMLKNRSLLLLSGFYALHSFYYYTWAGWAPALVMLKGGTPEFAGFISSLTLWIGIPATFIIPRLVHRAGINKPFLWASAITMVISALVWASISLDMTWLLMVLVGFADSAILVIVLALPTEMVQEEEVGAASGLLISAGHIGGAVGPLIGGHTLDRTGNLNTALLILVGIAIAAVVLAFRLPETGPKGWSNN